ncbi:MAG: isopenicillin N synthase family dioxygenase [Betaproteobacteria bacterium]
MSIPTIDIGPFLGGTAEARRRIAAQVRQTCERTGFLIISGHRFPAELLERAKRELFAFFDLPLDTKQRWHPSGPAKQRGYHGFATRGLAKTLGQQTPPDLRETVFLGPVDDHRGYFAAMPEAATSYAPNLLPTQPAGIDKTLVALYRAYERLAEDMMRVFAAALGLPESFFDGTLSRHFSIMSCHHYPVLDTPPKPGQLRTGAHTDYGAMTILTATDAQGGLEARLADGTWAGVQPKAGELVVNLGDMMARWTNERWVSTLHRVVNPPLGSAQSRRLSIGMFVHPSYDQRIECVPTCLAPGEKPRYEPITAGEHIKRKIEASHAAA